LMKQANWRRKRFPASAIVIQQFLTAKLPVDNWQTTGKSTNRAASRGYYRPAL
jgi:hypothetical protein